MRILTSIVFALLLATCARSLSARQIDPTKPPLPPPAEAPRSTPAPATSAIDPSTPPPPPPAETSSAPAAPVFDPLHAEKSMEVGTFYMKRGKYDAAIDRFQEAARDQPSLARPWVLLGEAYEKKRDNVRALESYRKYLDIFPGAEDAAKVQKRIAALEEKIGPQASKRSAN